MKVRLPVWLGTFVLLLLLSAPPAHATVPGTLLVEGTLANIAGAPVADGPYSVVFTVYGDAVSPTPLWTEGPLSVVVKSGGFSQLLGVTTPLTGALLAAGTSPMLALKVAADPELPRKPMASVPFALRAGTAESLDCTGCVSATALAPSVFAAITAASNLAKVASTGAYADLTGTPTLVALGQACGTGQVVSGIDATGKVVCAASTSLGGDPLGYVSGGTLSNVAATATAGSVNLPIPDNAPTGLTDSIVITNTAAIATISVAVNITNSDISHLTVTLVPPDNSVIVLFNKNGPLGGNIVTSYPDQTPVYSGNLAGWSGKAANGTWQLRIIDSAAQAGGGTFDGKLNSWGITLGYASPNKVEVKGSLTIDGNLTVNGTNNIFPTGAIIGFTGSTCPVGWIPANGTNNTPNMAGRMPIGVGSLPFGGTSVTYAATGGTNKWRLSVGTGSTSACTNNCGSSFSYLNAATMDFESPNSVTANAANNNAGGAYLEIMPPYIGVYFCVKQ